MQIAFEIAQSWRLIAQISFGVPAKEFTDIDTHI